MIQLNNIYKTFHKGTVNEKKALNGLNLQMKKGDFVTVIGGNGAGKSTMLNVISGVYYVESGSVIFDDKDITKKPEYKSQILRPCVPRPYERYCSRFIY